MKKTEAQKQREAAYKAGMKQCHTRGTAHATGDGLRAMYAKMLPFHCCLVERLAAPVFFAHLQQYPEDKEIEERARHLLRNPMDAAALYFNHKEG